MFRRLLAAFRLLDRALVALALYERRFFRLERRRPVELE